VTALLQADRISWDAASHLLPLLQHIVDTHRDTAIKETATNVSVLIATHGRVSASGCDGMATETARSESQSVNSCMKETGGADESKAPPLIEVISSSSNQASSELTLSAFETSMKEVEDGLIPIRGHALLTLRRLVDAGDTEASADRLLAVCDAAIDDTDSYIYLHTVQLLASLANRFPQQTLPWLADRYLAVGQSPAAGVGCYQRISERRMKLGEVLVKTSSALGTTKKEVTLLYFLFVSINQSVIFCNVLSCTVIAGPLCTDSKNKASE